MLELVYSNRLEHLLSALGARIRASARHVLDPIDLLVPNRQVATFVRMGIAARFGIAAHIRFERFERYLAALLVEHDPRLVSVGRSELEALILRQLIDPGLLEAPALEPVREYVHGLAGSESSASEGRDGLDRRRVQLAGQLARLFEEYIYSRPEMLAAWPKQTVLDDSDQARSERWQRALWLSIFGPQGLTERLAKDESRPRFVTLAALLEGPGSGLPSKAALVRGRTLHVFGSSYVARGFFKLLGALAQQNDVYVYALNPCREFWEDVETPGELRRRSLGSPSGPEEDPYRLAESETPPLALWGRPGRENIRLLSELTDCDFSEDFAEPEDERVLGRLQGDILERRAPSADPPLEVDDSLRLFACPSLRREVEVVADEIWHAIETSVPPLRFSDILVLVNRTQREAYLSRIRATFESHGGIPISISDIPMVNESRIVGAVRLLLELPFGRFSRRELLQLMTHPAVLGRFDDVSPEDFVDLTDALGIFFGADHEDHAGTYIRRDVINWDQGIKRLVLGAFMTGDPNGDPRLFQVGDERYATFALGPATRSIAARFGLLARSLIEDAKVARDASMRPRDWATFFARQIDAYFFPKTDEDERDRLRALEALEGLNIYDLDDHPISGRIATELYRTRLEALVGGRGKFMADGVAVSSFVPMRAIPFRHVFVLGLGEGLFPAGQRRDPLDLRAARRMVGDVSPAERDRYAFLETLLSARERLVLSYVARDEQTGERLAPSAVVQELLEWVVRLGLDEDALTEEFPLRRYDARYFPELAASAADVPERPTRARGARGEARALALGAALGGRLEGLPAELTESMRAVLRRIEAPPSNHTEVPAEGLSLGFAALRRFLECPMQGSARARLGLERDDDEDRREREEEHFVTPRLEELRAIERSFVRSSQRGLPAEAIYNAQAEFLELGGAMPTGVLGEMARRRHLGILRAFFALAEDVVHPVERYRFGQSVSDEPATSAFDPLVLEIPRGSGTVRVSLEGHSEILAAGGQISLVLRPRAAWSPGERTQAKKWALRGFMDHLILSASGRHAEKPRELWILLAGSDTPDQQRKIRFDLAPLTQAEARAYLTQLLIAFYGPVHAYLLPCEAVFESEVLEGAPIDALLEKIERIFASGQRRVSSHFGPVPRPERYPSPTAAEAAALIQSRFALFGRVVRAVEERR